MNSLNENTKELNIKNIDAYYDLFDQACMIIYDSTKQDYLSCFLRVYNDIYYDSLDTKGIDEEKIEELKKLEDDIVNFYALNEEIRQALLLLLIKGYKHANMNLDAITPDNVSLLFAYIIKKMYEDTNKKVSITDLMIGSGNLINVIANNTNLDLDLTGIEIDNKMANISKAYSDLQGNEIRIYNNSCLALPIRSNVIIGDLEANNKDEAYLPYELILKLVDDIREIDNPFDTRMIFLIDNDFFNHKGIEEFKLQFAGTLMALIVLPEDMFQGVGKSILIISPRKLKNYQTLVSSIPSFKEEKNLMAKLADIGEWVKETYKNKR